VERRGEERELRQEGEVRRGAEESWEREERELRQEGEERRGERGEEREERRERRGERAQTTRSLCSFSQQALADALNLLAVLVQKYKY
jgi:hypothetical protein